MAETPSPAVVVFEISESALSVPAFGFDIFELTGYIMP
jgi:hypothetical protein